MLVVSLVVLFAPSDGGAPRLPGLDKAVHLALFAALAGATRWRFGSRTALVVAVAGYAVLSELVQAALLPTRSGDALDVVADLGGAAAGWLLAGRLLRRAQPTG